MEVELNYLCCVYTHRQLRLCHFDGCIQISMQNEKCLGSLNSFTIRREETAETSNRIEYNLTAIWAIFVFTAFQSFGLPMATDLQNPLKFLLHQRFLLAQQTT